MHARAQKQCSLVQRSAYRGARAGISSKYGDPSGKKCVHQCGLARLRSCQQDRPSSLVVDAEHVVRLQIFLQIKAAE